MKLRFVCVVLCACGSSGSGSDAGPDVAPSDGQADVVGDGGVRSPECPTVASDPQIKQALPQATVDTTMPAMTGKTTTVKSGDSLQAAIDAAQPGDTLALEAGATFTGPITLPNKTGTDWIIIRTATPDAQFAMPGTRVSPALAPKLAKILASSTPIT